MLEARDLTVRGQRQHAAATASTSPCARAASTVLIGPNGAGKSTLLRVLSRRARADARRACCSTGGALAALPAAELARRPRRRAAVERADAFPSPCSRSPCWASRCRASTRLRRLPSAAALEALDAVGLSRPGGPPLRASVGRRAPARAHRPRAVPARRARRAAPARRAASCSTSPPPASTSRTRRWCWTAVRRQAGRGLAVLAVLHDLNLAAALADELVLLVRGEVAAAGPPPQVLRDDLLSAAYGCQVRTNRTPGRRPALRAAAGRSLRSRSAGSCRQPGGNAGRCLRNAPPMERFTFGGRSDVVMLN